MLLIAGTFVASACDICGASAGNQNLGLLPQMNRHFAGIQYQYNTFGSVYRYLSDSKPDRHDEQHYRTVQLWGRYCIGDNWQLFAFVPYRSNVHISDNTYTYTNGIGDISLLVNRIIYSTPQCIDSGWRHRLQGGVGIKAPTGKYIGTSELQKSGVPNMQPGTGSWDVPINLNYTISKNAYGINVDASYSFTTVSKDGYKFGNKLNSQLSAFYHIQKGKLFLFPQIGFRYEYSLHDYDNYARRWLNTQTGGHILSATVGVQLYLKSVGVQMSYQKPVYQKYAQGFVTPVGRFDSGILFLL